MNKSPEHTEAAKFLSRVADIAAPVAFAEAAIFLFFTGNLPLAATFAVIGRVLLGAHEDLKHRNTLQWSKRP